MPLRFVADTELLSLFRICNWNERTMEINCLKSVVSQTCTNCSVVRVRNLQLDFIFRGAVSDWANSRKVALLGALSFYASFCVAASLCEKRANFILKWINWLRVLNIIRVLKQTVKGCHKVLIQVLRNKFLQKIWILRG